MSSTSHSTAPERPIFCAETTSVPALTLMSTHTSRARGSIFAYALYRMARYASSIARLTASRWSRGSAANPSRSVASWRSAATTALRFSRDKRSFFAFALRSAASSSFVGGGGGAGGGGGDDAS